jgi:hypothetical protein
MKILIVFLILSFNCSSQIDSVIDVYMSEYLEIIDPERLQEKKNDSLNIVLSEIIKELNDNLMMSLFDLTNDTIQQLVKNSVQFYRINYSDNFEFKDFVSYGCNLQSSFDDLLMNKISKVDKKKVIFNSYIKERKGLNAYNLILVIDSDGLIIDFHTF